MIISSRILGHYIDLPAELEQLVHTLTFSGIEVEAIKEIPELPPTVISARIISTEPVPDSNHLTKCMVDHGGPEPIQVVCGAPNCREGLVSALALPGTKLGDFTIKPTKLRGVESFGMLASEREMGISDNHAGIVEFAADTPVGISVNELYELPDAILELEITPNRPDLLGYVGIARDLSASLNLPLKEPVIQKLEGEKQCDMGLKLVVEDPEKCLRYTARLMEGVTVKESPQWLKTALIKSGLRPINNIVDVTNFVMFELGQPLHAFNYEKLRPLSLQDVQPAIVVRKARAGEKFEALDGKSLELDEADLVIADGQEASALAGVIGGMASSIDENTHRIVLESACFQSTTVRASSTKHKVSTDSSYRFERQLSPFAAETVSHRAVELILETAGGKLCGDLYDAFEQVPEPLRLTLRPQRFEELIGYRLSPQEITRYLEALDCKLVQENPDGMVFQIPHRRVDLTREADLLEELARLAGYDRIPSRTSISGIMDRHAFKNRRKIEDWFVQAAFHEALNFSFSDPAQYEALGLSTADVQDRLLKLVNPQSSNQSVMRISLLPQLLENLRHNLHHGERDLKLMEIGKIYCNVKGKIEEKLVLTAVMTGKAQAEHWLQKSEAVGLWYVKGLVEGLLQSMGLPITETKEHSQPWLAPGDNLAWLNNGRICASFGRLKTQTAENFDIDLGILKQEIWVLELDIDLIAELTRDRETVFRDLPRYPAVTRDLSFVIQTSVPYSQIREAIQAVAPELISEVQIFDQYLGESIPQGFRSVSLRLKLLDREKTLTDERVDELLASVREMLSRTWQIKMR
ncbi:MAG: phenylalanine--tRNA ligase subunit beta [Candidatus Cloacimonetes bacterium]|nr:phenylalanine--tRNA ligase subunit beta [Candidatus Cloacimonadota bacterium]